MSLEVFACDVYKQTTAKTIPRWVWAGTGAYAVDWLVSCPSTVIQIQREGDLKGSNHSYRELSSGKNSWFVWSTLLRAPSPLLTEYSRRPNMFVSM